MDAAKILEIVFTLKGIRNFFTIQNEDGSINKDQLTATIIQALIFISLIITIGIFLV